jgi:hypothetical protein
VERVRDWLGAAYPHWPLTVERVRLPAPAAPRSGRRREQRAFAAAFDYARRHHGWLKWFARKRLGRRAQYEVDVLLPPELGWRGRWAGRLLLRPTELGWGDFSMLGWTVIRSDVAAPGVLAEVGITSPRSLVEPLWGFAVNRVLWLPYPPAASLRDDWSDFDAQVCGFVLRRGACEPVGRRPRRPCTEHLDRLEMRYQIRYDGTRFRLRHRRKLGLPPWRGRPLYV